MIIQYPDSRLKTVCSVADVATGAKIGLELLREMRASKIVALGLAAPQIGEMKRVFVMEMAALRLGGIGIFINPELSHKSSHTVVQREGCLSHPPDFILPVRRAAMVTLRAWDESGHAVKLKLTGMAARCAQHEIDHLDGINIGDRTPKNVLHTRGQG